MKLFSVAGKMISFTEFYGEVRQYFSSCVVEYERFKEAGSIPGKIEYLLDNEVVKTAAAALAKSTEAARPRARPSAKEVKPATASAMNTKQGTRFPQMSPKLRVNTNKKRGRGVVADQKILPGTYTIFASFHVLLCVHTYKFIASPT